MTKCFNQREVTRRRDKETGLNNVAYSIEREHEISVDGASALIINIKLKCNREVTPWCSCDDSDKSRQPSDPLPVKVDVKSVKVDSVIVPNVKKTVKLGQNKRNL